MFPSPVGKQEDQKLAVTSQKLALATHYHQTGRLKEAEQLYRNILVEQPNHAEVNSNMGVLASQTGRINDALYFFQAALGSDPKNGQTWANYMLLLYNTGRTQEASSALQQSLAIDKNFSLLFEGVYNQALNLQCWKDVENILHNLIAIKNSPSNEMAMLGEVLRRQGKLSDAERVLSDALNINENNVAALHNLSVLLLYLNRYSEAEHAIMKVLSLMPDNAESIFILGAISVGKKCLSEGEIAF